MATEETKQRETLWSNATNQKFYNQTTPEDLRSYAEIAGLSASPDLDQLQAYIKQANSIVEIGAGYGRVLGALTAQYPEKQFACIENSDSLLEHLRAKYAESVNIIAGNIKYDNLDGSYDLILWLWSGFADFAQAEQADVLANVLRYLNKTGFLVIDTLPATVTPLCAQSTSPQSYQISYNDASVYTYSVSKKEISRYCEQLDCKIVDVIPYKTVTDRQRELFILQKV